MVKWLVLIVAGTHLHAKNVTGQALCPEALTLTLSDVWIARDILVLIAMAQDISHAAVALTRWRIRRRSPNDLNLFLKERKMEIKFCIDCKWLNRGECFHPAHQYLAPYLVSGVESDIHHPEAHGCRTGPGKKDKSCGREGFLFEPKV